jgi:UDP-N-acetylglucosamine:LPS N-acetylglucosamine transferase
MKKNKKVLLVASAGGHLLQLLNIYKSLDNNHDYCWVCFKYNFVEGLLKNGKLYYGYEPTNRNLYNFFRNLLLAAKVFYKEKPDIIISTGAGIALPFFFLGFILNKKNIFVESISRIYSPSLSGKILYYLSNDFFVQWPEIQKYFPKAKYGGKLL